MEKIYIKEIRPNKDYERNFKKEKGITKIQATGYISSDDLIALQIFHLKEDLFIERKFKTENTDSRYLYYVKVKLQKTAAQELLTWVLCVRFCLQKLSIKHETICKTDV